MLLLVDTNRINGSSSGIYLPTDNSGRLFVTRWSITEHNSMHSLHGVLCRMTLYSGLSGLNSGGWNAIESDPEVEVAKIELNCWGFEERNRWWLDRAVGLDWKRKREGPICASSV